MNATEKRWDRDHAAYRSLVRGGVQPETLDGCARLEALAVDKREIEQGRLLSAEQREAFDIVDGVK